MPFLLLYSDGYLLSMTIWLLLGAVGFWLLAKCSRRWKEISKRRRLLLQTGLSVWVFLAVLTALELYFAVFYDTTDSFNMTNVSRKWYKLHADTQMKPLLVGNEKGFLYRDDREFQKSIETDRRHICFLGDSFTFGHGIAKVADRFSNLVGDALQEQHPNQFAVTNLAGAGTDLHWIEAQLNLLFEAGIQIDTVIYVICLNDIETFHPRHRTYYVDFGKRVGAPTFFLFRDTYFLNLLYYRIQSVSVPELRDYYAFVREYYDGEPWQRMRLKLDEVRQLCRSNQADLRIVVFPFLHNLGPGYPFRDAHKGIVDYCQQANIPVVDLEPLLTRHRGEGLTVNRLDAHPNERAHGLAALAIQEQLLPDYFNGSVAMRGR